MRPVGELLYRGHVLVAVLQRPQHITRRRHVLFKLVQRLLDREYPSEHPVAHALLRHPRDQCVKHSLQPTELRVINEDRAVQHDLKHIQSKVKAIPGICNGSELFCNMVVVRLRRVEKKRLIVRDNRLDHPHSENDTARTRGDDWRNTVTRMPSHDVDIAREKANAWHEQLQLLWNGFSLHSVLGNQPSASHPSHHNGLHLRQVKN
jgi:hypothetical protein